MGPRIARIPLLATFACVALAGCLPEEAARVGRPAAATRPNAPPTIGGNPSPTAITGNTWQFVPTAGDADGDNLVFTASGLPGWLNLNPNTGALWGTPGIGDLGTSADIHLAVSDGEASASLPAFRVLVISPPGQTPPFVEPAPPAPDPAAPNPVPGNKAPVVSGVPPSAVAAGSNYYFRPVAYDPDDDEITWSISGKPAAAAFNPATGELSWTPANTGTWPNIVITARDSKGAATSLPAFTITATGTPTGMASLSWLPPSLYTDDTPLQPLVDLDSYHIYHGLSPNSLVLAAEVNSGTSSFILRELGTGTHYFAVSAVSILGIESTLSQVGSKTVE